MANPLRRSTLDCNLSGRACRGQFRGVTLVTGPIGEDHRTRGIEKHVASWLCADAKKQHIPLLVEADGARRSSLNAPGEEEPPIPHFVNGVVVVAGLSGLPKPLSQETVHRPEIFSQLSGLKIGHLITAKEARSSALPSRWWKQEYSPLSPTYCAAQPMRHAVIDRLQLMG